MTFLSKIYLKKGWNLINFSLENINLKKVIQNKNIIEIKNQNKSYNKDVPLEFNTLNNLNVYSGYWLKSEKDCIVDFNGSCIKKKVNIQLKEGWNLIGYPYNIKYNVNDLLNSNILEIKDTYSSYNMLLPPSFNNLTELKENCAYWINSKTNFVLSLDYPYEYKVIKNGNLKGLITFEDNIITNLDDLDYEFYHIETINVNNDDLLINYNFRIKIFYINNHVEGVDIIDNIKLPDNFEGDICLTKSIDNIINIKFNNRIDTYLKINLEKTNILLHNFNNITDNQNIKIKELQLIDSNNLSSYFLSDYDLEKLNIKNINFFINDNQIVIENYDLLYNSELEQLKLSILTNNNKTFIFNIKTGYTKDKSVEIELLNNDLTPKRRNYTIIKNNPLLLSIDDIHFKLYMDWEGKLKEKVMYIPYQFQNDSTYLYWYDLNTVKFSFNNIENVGVIESGKDYIIIKSNNYLLYFIKSITYVGSINFIIIKDNLTVYTEIIPIYQGIKLPFNIKIDWEGELNNSEYIIRKSNILNQRKVGENLNSFKLIKGNTTNYKVHYYIGDSPDSIDLIEWKNYNNYLEVITSFIEYFIKYFQINNIHFNTDDDNIKNNGGDNSYDIYVVNSTSKLIEETNNNQKISHIIISSKLDYNSLKYELFDLILKAIIKSYNSDIWIEDNMYLAINYIFINEINQDYINDFVKYKELSLNYTDKIIFENNSLTIKPGYNRFLLDIIKVDNTIINIQDIYKLESDNLKISKLQYKIKSINQTNFLELELTNNISTDIIINILINNKQVTHIDSTIKNRYYGSFIFYVFLIKSYGYNVVSNILKNKLHLPLYKLDNAIKENSKDNFEKSYTKFWINAISMNSKINVSSNNYFDNLSYQIINKPEYITINNIIKSSVLIYKINFTQKNGFGVYMSGNYNINDYYRTVLYIRDDNSCVNFEEMNDIFSILNYDDIKEVYLIIISSLTNESDGKLVINIKDIELYKDDKEIIDFTIKILRN